MDNVTRTKKGVTLETFLFLIVFGAFFGYVGSQMGVSNMFGTLMNTAHYLLIDVVFFIMAIAVIAGAMGALLSEFGVISLINKLISPIMRPIYGLPGAASIGMITTYLSDNPAIISLANDRGFKKYFKNYELPTLCNLGTAFGMGLILTTYMIGLGDGPEFMPAAIIGNLGAFVGSIVSVRIMMIFSLKHYNADPDRGSRAVREAKKRAKAMGVPYKKIDEKPQDIREIREGTTFERVLDSVLEGGKAGVDMGMAIIPGVIVICTIVMILTFGPGVNEAGAAVYTGAKKEGIALLPKIGEFLSPVLRPIFGFKNAEAIAFPITSLGSAGAAMGLVKDFINQDLVSASDIAVFTAMGMCWSGYLSTHVGMMDALGVRKLSSKAILSHTVGGIVAGMSAHYMYMLVNLL